MLQEAKANAKAKVLVDPAVNDIDEEEPGAGARVEGEGAGSAGDGENREGSHQPGTGIPTVDGEAETKAVQALAQAIGVCEKSRKEVQNLLQVRQK